jgi:peroxiredoxin (alkyl hydroperoxide reductase subunit C)
MAVQVGKPAPEFTTRAYMGGRIQELRLADYRGQWVLLYFYPGDFTFV